MLYGIFETDGTGRLAWVRNVVGTGEGGRLTRADAVEAFEPLEDPYQFAIPLAAFRDFDGGDIGGELGEDSTPA